MPRSSRRAVGASLVAAAITLLGAQSAAAADPSPSFVPGEVVVRFEPGVDSAERRAARDQADADFDRSLLLARTQVVEVDGPVRDAVRELEAQPGVAYAEPNYIYSNAAAPPNDPRFGELWGLSNVGQVVQGTPGSAGVDIDALPAWDRTRGAGQLIAIVDGGVAMEHPDIAPNVWTNPGEVPGNGLDDDLNGFVDDAHGWNFVDGNGDPGDQGTSHGTHVAGTAAAAANNGVGVAGVAPEATIMPVAGTDENGQGTNVNLAQGIAYAAREGATVINGSFSGPSKSATMESAIVEAGARGTVVVVAAGNDDRRNVDVNPMYPCAYAQANLICVAALDPDGSLASYSNVGPASVDVGAPGTGVLSTSSFQTLFADDFSSPIGARWDRAGTNNTWEAENGLLTDSPGGLPYKPSTNASVTMSVPLSLLGRTGCEAAWRQLRNTEKGFDFLDLGVVDGGGSELPLGSFTGSNGGFLEATQSLSAVEGSSSVRFRFTLTSDPTIEADGVYIDDFGIRCRARPGDFDATTYINLDGTSMASPHVAGAVALVRAAGPGLSPGQVVDRIKATAVPTASLQGVTATGGRVDAAAALPPPPAPPVAQPAAPIKPPCAGLTRKKLAVCKLNLKVAATCGRLKGKKRATCAKRVRALAACKALPARSKKAKAKRKACIKKASKIGKAKPKKHRPSGKRRR